MNNKEWLNNIKPQMFSFSRMGFETFVSQYCQHDAQSSMLYFPVLSFFSLTFPRS